MIAFQIIHLTDFSKCVSVLEHGLSAEECADNDIAPMLVQFIISERKAKKLAKAVLLYVLINAGRMYHICAHGF